MLLMSCIVAAAALRAGHQLFLQHAHHFQPGIVDLHEFADRRARSRACSLWPLRPERRQRAAFVVGIVEEAAFGELQAVDRSV